MQTECRVGRRFSPAGGRNGSGFAPRKRDSPGRGGGAVKSKQVQPEPRSSESHWRVNDPEGQPCHADIISCTRAVQEALAALGCEASDEEVRRRLREQGIEVEAGMIARVREE